MAVETPMVALLTPMVALVSFAFLPYLISVGPLQWLLRS